MLSIKFRRQLCQEEPNLSPDAQQALYIVTTLYERLVWLIRRYALLLQGRVA
jgi:hypothetical protein